MYYLIKTKDKNYRVEKSQAGQFETQIMNANTMASLQMPDGDVVQKRNIIPIVQKGNPFGYLKQVDLPNHYICDKCMPKALYTYRKQGIGFEEAERNAKDTCKVLWNDVCDCSK